MFDQLAHALRSISDMPLEEINKFKGICREKTVLKGYFFIREGDVPQKFAFVHQGLFRYYYSDKNGKELTKGFFPENSFITAYSAMARGLGSYYNIEALEDATITVIDFEKWKQLALNKEHWNYFLIALLEKGYIKKEKREREFLLCDAEERYKSFLEEYPQLEKRIKQHMIASYLGITPVALSRIRKKMGIINIG
ncbi:MAG TPA: Crp/Fnr family transcriptional regulator [Cytophagales bacterium]|nr:Crp/Fnr family transcriptional regulator [Cytophagales bacterium]